ncbi:MAG: VOC family protein [Acidimicrobiales bacterium]
MGARFTELIVDSHDPDALARFWGEVLGWPRADHDDGIVEIKADAGPPSLVFVPVQDEKRVKNRLHIDLNPVGCEQHEELARLLALGATQVDIGQGGQSWVVLADPEGNEFCLLSTRLGDRLPTSAGVHLSHGPSDGTH